MARLNQPHHAVVGDVGPDEIATGRKPRRPLAPAPAAPQPLDAHVAGVELAKSLVVGNESRPLDVAVIHYALLLEWHVRRRSGREQVRVSDGSCAG